MGRKFYSWQNKPPRSKILQPILPDISCGQLGGDPHVIHNPDRQGGLQVCEDRVGAPIPPRAQFLNRGSAEGKVSAAPPTEGVGRYSALVQTRPARKPFKSVLIHSISHRGRAAPPARDPKCHIILWCWDLPEMLFCPKHSAQSVVRASCHRDLQYPLPELYSLGPPYRNYHTPGEETEVPPQ